MSDLLSDLLQQTPVHPSLLPKKPQESKPKTDDSGKGPRCKYCGTSNVYWSGGTMQGWRLKNNSGPDKDKDHCCKGFDDYRREKARRHAENYGWSQSTSRW